MAIVFISPKQRQRTFFLAGTALIAIFLVFLYFWVFLSKPSEVPSALVFNAPKVTINTAIFDSDEFKNLQPSAEIQNQYSYTAITKSNKTETGFISATSIDQATLILTNAGLKVTELKEIEVGRDNPFTPYYQSAPAPTK